MQLREMDRKIQNYKIKNVGISVRDYKITINVDQFDSRATAGVGCVGLC